MKEIVHGPGGRLYKGEDFLAMQQLTLDLTEKIYAQRGNLILYGCEITGNNISPGVVMLGGKACLFAGATNATMPFYVKKVKVTENVPYKTGDGAGYDIYTAVQCAGIDVGAFDLHSADRYVIVIERELNSAWINAVPTGTGANKISKAKYKLIGNDTVIFDLSLIFNETPEILFIDVLFPNIPPVGGMVTYFIPFEKPNMQLAAVSFMNQTGVFRMALSTEGNVIVPSFSSPSFQFILKYA